MNKSRIQSFYAALASCGLLFWSVSTFAADTALPEKPQAQSTTTESIQPMVEQKSADQMAQKRSNVIADAVVAVAETENALLALEQKKPEEAISALEAATGKLELILARDPSLAFAPVSIEMTTVDLIASTDTVREVIAEAEKYLKEGEIQKARPLVANLASEIEFRTTSIPLITYPVAIRAVVPLIDEGKYDEARAGLQAALNMLVETTDEVIPLPKIRAESMIGSAESLAKTENRTASDNEELTQLLKEARNQLEMAELLGYGTRKSYRDMYEQLDQIEAKTAGGKVDEGWFERIKKQLSELF
jgi:hypothetical protein